MLDADALAGVLDLSHVVLHFVQILLKAFLAFTVGNIDLFQ